MFCRVVCLLVLSLSTALSESREAFRLAPLFSDRAVLQRDKPVAVWGLAEPGDQVKVEFAGQTKECSAGQDGRWKILLDPLKMSVTPQVLRATSSRSGVTLTADDLLVGDVWFCSGQSNMTFSVRESSDGAKEMAEADFPLIRGWRSPLVASEHPEFSNAAFWSKCTPHTETQDGAVRSWAAAAYFFAREVHRETGVPIGLIMSSYGGTEIESWMSGAAIKDSGEEAFVMGRWNALLARLPEMKKAWEINHASWVEEAAEAEKRGEKPKRREPRLEGPGSRKQPSSLYNAMVAPFIPYGLRGFLWYQGESNVGRHETYKNLFPALIRSWRTDFGQGDLPFYFVQIANIEPKNSTSPDDWAFLREAQASALSLPQTGMAIAVDIGDAKLLHPPNKQDVGRRLALHALKNEFNKDVITTGPVFQGAERKGSSMLVSFQGDPKLDLKGNGARAFELAGADRKFFPATAQIEGNHLSISSPDVPEPVAVRYAWWNQPNVVLFGASGLPAPPFRSDAWPMAEVSQ